jgi:hypothetical protein
VDSGPHSLIEVSLSGELGPAERAGEPEALVRAQLVPVQCSVEQL